MKNQQVKTRFAPSPTGYLHIGGARTALFNWLYARRHNGSFLLRIEDTDRERSTEEAVNAIIKGLRWLGLDWDEGPYRQSERTEIYKEKIQELLDKGLAYRCDCSPEELEEKRKAAMAAGKKPMYDGKCRNNPPPNDGRPCVIRFKAPKEGETVINDLLRGEVVFKNEELDDLIIARRDGSPTYNFVVVVDDATMGITHVIRGDDHLSNTPKQIQLYRALGYEPPAFAHLPLILGQDKKRLSKRHGATSVLAYRDEGYLPEAVVNFLARIGWAHGDKEVFSIEELKNLFDLSGVGKSAGVFNAEKLLWLNMHYIKETGPAKLTDKLADWLKEVAEDGETEEAKNWALFHLKNYPVTDEKRKSFEKLIFELSTRAKTLKEMVEQADFFFHPPEKYDEKGAKKFLKPEIRPALEEIIASIEKNGIQKDVLEKSFKDTMEKHGLKMLQLAQAARLAMTGKTVSPGIFEVMEALGKEEVLSRLKALTSTL